MKRVFYDYRSAYDHGINDHAQTQMNRLGIKWSASQGQSLFDGFEFWVDDDVALPPYVRELKYEQPPS